MQALFILLLAAASSAVNPRVDISSGSVVNTVKQLRAGQYVWAPEIAPAGPMLLIVNVKTQRAVLYRNGVPIGATTISTGRPGHETPTGIFTILEKAVVHYSSKYDDAPMPYMQRLTWKGIALHAGNLPGYPASHGCIRMPAGFAKLMYGISSIGMTVVIANIAAVPRVAPGPGLLSAVPELSARDETVTWQPDKSLTGPVSIVVSEADARALVLRNGIVIGSAPVAVKAPVAGTWAYELRNIDSCGHHWVRLRLTPGGDDEAVAREEWQKFEAPEAFRKAVASIVAPGMTIVITSESLRSAAAPAMVLESKP